MSRITAACATLAIALCGLCGVAVAQPFIEIAELTPNKGEEDAWFGATVSLDGTRVAVGASRDDDDAEDAGAVYLFRQVEGIWELEQKLLIGDGVADRRWPSSVALRGDVLVAGADFDGNGSAITGAAYVFRRIGETWELEEKLLASDGANLDGFGREVDFDGETIVVSAAGDDSQGQGSGAAYVFVREAGSWIQKAKLTASDGESEDFFGQSVTVDGEWIVVGAYRQDAVGFDSGAAYVFERDFNDIWNQDQKLTASDGGPVDNFGWSAALRGGTLVIGAIGDNGLKGAVYVFSRQGVIWFEEQKLVPPDALVNDWFGASVATDGATILAGSPFHEALGWAAGAAYVYREGNSGFSLDQKLLAEGGEPGDQFGEDVTVDGENAVVGLPAYGPGARDSARALSTNSMLPAVSTTGTVVLVLLLMAGSAFFLVKRRQEID